MITIQFNEDIILIPEDWTEELPEEAFDEDAIWEEYELHKDIAALEAEIEDKKIQRSYDLKRIALDARNKGITPTLVYRFFKDYNISLKEQTCFWMWYYNPYWG